MSQQLQWGIISTGKIAECFANALKASELGELAAVGSRSQASADRFVKAFGGRRAHPSYEDLLADREVQAVYVATPHPWHAQWAIAAARAGKHILCEKPFALNHAEAMTVFEAAREAGVLVMEAFMYRCHPQTAKVLELIRGGAIGEVRMIQASFGFNAGFNAESRLFADELGGGGIMDVGCYPVSMSRLIAGAALGRPFANPVEVCAAGHRVETGVDGWSAAVLKFEQDIVAQVATGVQVSLDNHARIYGSEGSIDITNPWTADRKGGGTFSIHLNQRGQAPRTIEVETEVTSFTLEADFFARMVSEGRTQADSPAMSPADTLGNIQTLDRWRSAIGLVYEAEKPENYTHTVSRKPLKRRDDHNMRYGRIDGLDKDISRLVMGVDNQREITHASAMFDDFFERGGNAFDSAFVYGGGRCEEMLGWWVKNRSIRDQVVLLDKGAHTPQCDPENLTRQLMISLERLQTDYVDIYMMHRDNPDIPVGEFIDVINEHVKAGRIRVFGASNWSTQRYDEANDYASQNDLQGFSAMSNNLSLARMIDPVWAGCIAASDDENRVWHEQTKTPLMPWSSQARGFFTDRAAPDKHDDPQLVRCWYSEDNFKRRDRAMELAKKKDATTIQIALAYALNQPFMTFPLIGPRTIEETRTSLPALEIELTADELKWLDLRD